MVLIPKFEIDSNNENPDNLRLMEKKVEHRKELSSDSTRLVLELLISFRLTELVNKWPVM